MYSFLRSSLRWGGLALGLGLLVLNGWGLYRSLRNPALYSHPGVGFPSDLTLTYSQFWQETAPRAGEAEVSTVHRLTMAVNRGMAHYWPETPEEREAFYLRVPVWENFLLFAAAKIRPDIYGAYEFARVDKAMERGLGLCSQHATVLTTLLNRARFDARVLELNGHVVVAVRTPSRSEYVADPDYGVVIPHSIVQIEADPAIVRPYYESVQLLDPVESNRQALADYIVDLYGSKDNVLKTVPEYFFTKPYYVEYAAYVLKWLLPAMLVLVCLHGGTVRSLG